MVGWRRQSRQLGGDGVQAGNVRVGEQVGLRREQRVDLRRENGVVGSLLLVGVVINKRGMLSAKPRTEGENGVGALRGDVVTIRKVQPGKSSFVSTGTASVESPVLCGGVGDTGSHRFHLYAVSDVGG